VSQRLTLLDGPPEILESVRVGVISFDVARELLLFPTRDLGLLYLKYAIEGGASAKIVRRWRDDANLQAQMALAGEAEAPEGKPVEWNPARVILYCECCRESHTLQELTYMRVCNGCEGTIKANPEARNEKK
jgi:hypothetical protein